MVNCHADRHVPSKTETVIIGNGPSAMALSYLLHGYVPYYNRDDDIPHFDILLDRKLAASQGKPLYESLDKVNELCAHFEASGNYSRDAWPVNVLLDTLLWPNADMEPDSPSTVSFSYHAAYSKSHVVLGDAAAAGGQWADLDTCTNGDNAKTLSYAEQLSLPGYSITEFFKDEYGIHIPQFERPRRPQVSAYYAAYTGKVSISDVFHNNTKVTSVTPIGRELFSVQGFETSGQAFTIECRHVVLACGLFSTLIEPPALLSSYITPTHTSLIHHKAPVLIIGSGFSAADAIVENLGKRPIIHIFKWHTAQYISPLKHCHRSSYPEYADVYRRMKLSAQDLACYTDYRGFADTTISDVKEVNGHFEVKLEYIKPDSPSRKVVAGQILVLAGRRTSLDFLEPRLLKELQLESEDGWLEKSGLRDQITPIGPALTIDSGRILCIGSITGDSLVKFSYGAIMGAYMALT